MKVFFNQAGDVDICNLAKSIYAKGPHDDTSEICALSNSDKLIVMEKIDSDQNNCLSRNQSEQKEAVIQLNNEILHHVYRNCWCMEHQLSLFCLPE